MRSSDARRYARTHVEWIDEVLWLEWDPIGVNFDPRTRNEYTGYARQVFSLMHAGADAGAVSTYLQEVVRDRIELEPDVPNCDRVAKGLVDAFIARKSAL